MASKAASVVAQEEVVRQAPGLAFVLGVRLSYNGTKAEFADAYDALEKAVHKKHELLKVDRKIYICVDSFHFRQKTSFSIDAEDSTTLAALIARGRPSESTAKHFKVMSQTIASTGGKFSLRADDVEVHICFAEGAYV